MFVIEPFYYFTIILYYNTILYYSSVTNYFDNSANWSLTAHGSGGTKKPGKFDRAIFGGNTSSSDCDAEIRKRADIKRILIKGNYDGTVKVNDNITLKIREHFGLHGRYCLLVVQ